jgi:hypothetical protein
MAASALVPLERHEELIVVQKKELAELFGFESRNKYVIEAGGAPIAFAAEQGKDLLAAASRWLLGHWRTFEIHVFDQNRALWFRAIHPFRVFFQRLEIVGADGAAIGAIQQRFSVFSKRFDVTDASGRLVLTVKSPLWRPWTFAFERPETPGELAVVQKKWSGMLTELITDADRFRIGFRTGMSEGERTLVLAAALFIDLVYFERKAE